MARGILQQLKASDIFEDRSLTTIPFTVDTTYVNNGANVRCRARGKTVFMEISISLKALTASTSAYQVGSIPADYAPPFSMTSVIMNISSQQTMVFQVKADGSVEVFCPGSNGPAGWYDGSIMWMLD